MEIPKELTAGGRPSSAASMATYEQTAPGPVPIQPIMVEIATDQRSSEQVPPEAPAVDQVGTEERRVPKPGHEAPEQFAATPSTQEGVLPDAAA
jgi:hypothetical protein